MNYVNKVFIVCMFIGRRCDGEHTYLGCYWDDTNRALPDLVSCDQPCTACSNFMPYCQTMSMTVDFCVDLCKSKSFKYAGLQAGTMCFCGNEDAMYSQHGEFTSCATPCSGNSSQVCGDVYRNSVYDIVVCSPPSVSDGASISPGPYNYGESVTYFCVIPDAILIGDSTRMCTADGSWSGQEPICQTADTTTITTNVTTQRPTTTMHPPTTTSETTTKSVTTSTTNKQDNLQPTNVNDNMSSANEMSTPDASKTSLNVSSPSQSPSPSTTSDGFNEKAKSDKSPAASPRSCDALPTVPFGKLDSSSSGTLYPPETVPFVCDNGYSSSEDSVTCMEDGSWTPAECRPIGEESKLNITGIICGIAVFFVLLVIANVLFQRYRVNHLNKLLSQNITHTYADTELELRRHNHDYETAIQSHETPNIIYLRGDDGLYLTPTSNANHVYDIIPE